MKWYLRLYKNQKAVLSATGQGERWEFRYAGIREEEGAWVHTCYDVETDGYLEFRQLEVVDEKKRYYRVDKGAKK